MKIYRSGAVFLVVYVCAVAYKETHDEPPGRGGDERTWWEAEGE